MNPQKQPSEVFYCELCEVSKNNFFFFFFFAEHLWTTASKPLTIFRNRLDVQICTYQHNLAWSKTWLQIKFKILKKKLQKIIIMKIIIVNRAIRGRGDMCLSPQQLSATLMCSFFFLTKEGDEWVCSKKSLQYLILLLVILSILINLECCNGQKLQIF